MAHAFFVGIQDFVLRRLPADLKDEIDAGSPSFIEFAHQRAKPLAAVGTGFG
jgi:hypothetical protein